MSQQNGNPASGAEPRADGNHVHAKKPAGEDLSRWENEGGQPSMSAVPRPKKAALPNVSFEQVRERIEAEVRQRPLTAIGIASALGFMLGGGLRTRSGRKLLKRALAYSLDNLDKLKA